MLVCLVFHFLFAIGMWGFMTSYIHFRVYLSHCKVINCILFMGFPDGSVVKNLPAKQEMWVWSLAQEDSLEKEVTVHSSNLAWEILWTEEPGGLLSMGSQMSWTWLNNSTTTIISPLYFLPWILICLIAILPSLFFLGFMGTVILFYFYFIEKKYLIFSTFLIIDKRLSLLCTLAW